MVEHGISQAKIGRGRRGALKLAGAATTFVLFEGWDMSDAGAASSSVSGATSRAEKVTVYGGAGGAQTVFGAGGNISGATSITGAGRVHGASSVVGAGAAISASSAGATTLVGGGSNAVKPTGGGAAGHGQHLFNNR